MKLTQKDVTLTLSPSTIRNGGKIHAAVTNLSDVPQTYQIYGRHLEDKLLFSPDELHIQLPPQAVGEVEVAVELTKRAWFIPRQAEFEFEIIAENLEGQIATRGYLLASPPPLFWLALIITFFAILFFLMFGAIYSFDRRITANRDLLIDLLETQAIQGTAVSAVDEALQTAIAITPPTILAPSIPSDESSSADSSDTTATEPDEPLSSDDTPSETTDAEIPSLDSSTLVFSGNEDEPTIILLPSELPAGWRTRVISQPQQGVLTFVEENVYSYQPPKDFFGSVDFILEACNLDNACATATARININDVNDPPVADDDTLIFSEDDLVQDVTAELLSGDEDEAGSALVITAVQTDNPERVIFSESAGTVQYDPSVGFNQLAKGESAIDSFQYTIQDSAGATNTATVTIEVEGENDAPIAQDDGFDDTLTIFRVAEDSVSDGLTNALLNNDSDPDTNESLLLQIEAVNNDAEGGLISFINGDWVYDPSGAYEELAEGETAVDTFTYIISDPAGAVSNQATAQMTIVGVNDLPTLSLGDLSNPIVFSPTVSTTTRINIISSVVVTDIDNEALSGIKLAFEGGRPDGASEYLEILFQDNEIDNINVPISIASPPFSFQTLESALLSTIYVNESVSPTPGCRQVNVQLLDAAGGESNVETIFIQVGNSSCPTSAQTAVSSHLSSLPTAPFIGSQASKEAGVW